MADGLSKGVNFFLLKTLADVDSAERVILYPVTTVLYLNGALAV